MAGGAPGGGGCADGAEGSHDADPADWLNVHTEVVCGVWEPHAAYRKAIHFAQAVGRSIRFPFTDNRMAAFVQGLPEQLKFMYGVNKQVLRAYMKQSLHREIVQKPKSGFIFDADKMLSERYAFCYKQFFKFLFGLSAHKPYHSEKNSCN